MHAIEIATFCSIAMAGFACQWLAWRLRIPAILFLLFAGIMAGPVLGWLDTDALLGHLLTPLVSIAVAIILFEGSLTLKFSEIRGHGTVVRNLVTVGVVVTWVCSSLAAYFVLGWDAYLAALFGAIVTVSGPTVVMPLLRSVRPTAAVSSVLRWESILIDPLGAILALLVFDVIVATQTSQGLMHVVQTIGVILLTGVLLGVVGGYLFGLAFRKRLIPDLLREFSALAAVLTVFGVAEIVQSESGLLAVTIMGVWLANMRNVELEDVLNFKESITLVLIAVLFILLAAKLDLADLVALGGGAVTILAILQLVAGPLRAFASAAGSGLRWQERLFIGWVFPRGIVAAAISSLFALRLVEIDYPNAASLVPLVFTIIIGTVIIQSVSARVVSRALHVSAPDPTGVLVIGANSVALAIASALQKAGLSVLVSGSHWASIREARMRGLPVFYGSAVSSYAEEHLDLTGLGHLLAASRRPGLNELACSRFSNEFGRNHVFILAADEEQSHDKHKVSGETAGRTVFGAELTIEDLAQLLARGATLRTTELTEEFGLDEYRAEHPDRIMVCAIDPNRHVHFPVDDEEFTPAEGWSVIALSGPEEQSAT